MNIQNNTDNMTEDEFYEYRKKLIQDTFTEEDFLSCDITRDRLLNEFVWGWEKNGVPRIEEYYNGIRKQLQGDLATPLYYDNDGGFITELTGIAYKHLKKEYDISIFHDCPGLANPLISQYEDIQERKKKELKQQRNVCSDLSTNKMFDWGSKTYK